MALAVWNNHLRKVAIAQDRLAFKALFDHFAPLIKAYAFRASQADHGDSFSEELVQETMLKVWTKASSFDAELASASTWIFTIARNTRIDLLRKNARHTNNRISTDDDDSLLDKLDTEDLWIEQANTDIFDQLARQRGRKQVLDSLGNLPEAQSFVLKKVYLEDKSHSDVAAELNLPLGTVKSRVRLALMKMKLTVDR
jgi:RNA polymerase sigma-70 factor (ECF subfamily)